MQPNLTTELAQLLGITAGVATAIRMYSAYNRGDVERMAQAPTDVMWLSDSLHNFDRLGTAIQDGATERIVSACDDLLSMYESYRKQPSFERNARLVDLEGAMAVFGAIRAKVLVSRQARNSGVVSGEPAMALTITTLGGSGQQQLELAPVLQKTLHDGGGWVFLDGTAHGEAREPLEALVRRMGHLDHFHVVDLTPDAPTCAIDLMVGSPASIAAQLMSVVPMESNPGADFYNKQATWAIQTLVQAMQASGERLTLKGLSNFVQHPETLMKLLLKVPENTEAGDDLIELMNTYGSPQKLGTMLGGMAGRLACLTSGALGKVFAADAPEICMSDVIARHSMVYVKLGSDDLPPAIRRLIATTVRLAAEEASHQDAVQPGSPFALFQYGFDSRQN